MPAYGEYAPVEPTNATKPTRPRESTQQFAQHPYYAQQPGRQPLRTADLIVSVILLAVGLFGALTGVNAGVRLDYLMQVEYTQFGLDEYVRVGPFVAVQAVIIVSHLLLFVIAVPITITLIRKRRIAFWVPLTAGAIAAIIFWVAMSVLIFSDSALLEALQNQPL